MDPTLLAYLEAAIKGNKGVGGVLGNVDSPLLGVLSGGFNPETVAAFGRQNSSLLSQYANSQDPVIQAVLEQIYSGADPYALSSWLARYEATNPQAVQASGWQSQDLNRLATALQKEYTQGGESAKQDYWTKMGLSNPLDVYTLENVPLAGATAERVRQLDEEMARIAPETTRTKSALNIAAKQLEKAKTSGGASAVSRFFSGGDLAKLIERAGTDYNPVFGRVGGKAKTFVDWLKKQEQISVDDAMAQAKQMGVGEGASGFSGGMGVVEEGLGKTASTKARKRLEGLTPKTTSVTEGTPEFYAFREALNAAQRQTNKEYGLEQRKKATKKGALRAVQEQGRVPLTDEIKQRLAMLGMLGK